MNVGVAAGLAALSLGVACSRGEDHRAPPAASPEPPPASDPIHEQPGAPIDIEAGSAQPPGSRHAQPFRRAGDVTSGVDELVFWGWSADGRYFAFETFHAGAQMARCEGEAELSIVDATTDRYAEDGHIQLTYRDAEADVCDPPDLRVELGHRRSARLERYGIEASHISPSVSFEGAGERWTVALPDGSEAAVTFRVLHATDDPMDAADGAAFELRLAVPGRPELQVEAGARRRPWTLSYDLAQGMVFVGPGATHAALMVAQRQVMAEGVRTTWMSNGVVLR